MKAMRNIVEINEELCNGCGQCILDCAEGAIILQDGKAKVIADMLCDGLGACLSGCPTGALKIIQREADEYDESAVEKHLAAQGRVHAGHAHGHHGRHEHPHGHHGRHEHPHGHHEGHGHSHKHSGHAGCGCSGSAPAVFGEHTDHPHGHHGGHGHPHGHHEGHGHSHKHSGHAGCGCSGSAPAVFGEHTGHPHHAHGHHGGHGHPGHGGGCPGSRAQGFPVQGGGVQGRTWPLKVRLMSPEAPFLQGADLVIAADCTAFAAPGFHEIMGAGKVLLIACPKFEDREETVARLAAIFRTSASCTIVRMEVPCCKALTALCFEAKERSGRADLPMEEVILTRQGTILDSVVK